MSWDLLDSALSILLPVVVILSTFFTVFLLTLPSGYQPRSDTKKQDVRIQIVVLGDIGRSPRMQYHALSVAKHGGHVDLIGYHESDTHPEVATSKRISIVPISPSPAILQTNNKLLFLVFAPVKVLWQIFSLYYALSYKSKASKWMLVQNPPSIPTLAVAWFVCFVRNTKLVIDWHNFGYSILALKLGTSHPLVRISKQYELVLAKAASYHLTVTNAMARVLKDSFGVVALPLHDRPPAHFQPLDETQRSELLERLPETAQDVDYIQNGLERLIVSSTSWTPDEDFSILLEALVEYSAQASRSTKLPRILAIITGKGPQKEHYLSKVAELKAEGKLAKVDVKTAWLSMEDYASLLGAADLGISLHTSSSGVDLPMKVVDMFGTGLPVFGWSKFVAWPELVTEDVNGKGFTSPPALASLLVEYLGNDVKLKALRQGALKECDRRWDDEWNPVAGRLFGLVP